MQQLAVSIGRCQETIEGLMAELAAVNAKYEGRRRTTREEVEYLTELLSCAKQKLAWEKQITSLKKRAPDLLKDISKTLSDREFPPTEELKSEMLQSLQIVQTALERLQGPAEDASGLAE